MPTEQLLQIPVLGRDRFSITGFAKYITKWTEIKRNLQKKNQYKRNLWGRMSLYSIHSIPYTVHYTLYTVSHILYTMHYKKFSCLLSKFCCSAPFTNSNTNMTVVLLLRMSLYTHLVLVGFWESRLFTE
jgi:hypothetical protein